MGVYAGKEMTVSGGPECTQINILRQVALNLAELHSNTYIGTNKALISQTEDYYPSA